jgi:hypothetical protein
LAAAEEVEEEEGAFLRVEAADEKKVGRLANAFRRASCIREINPV